MAPYRITILVLIVELEHLSYPLELIIMQVDSWQDQPSRKCRWI